MKANENISTNAFYGASSCGQSVARDMMGEYVVFLKNEEGGLV